MTDKTKMSNLESYPELSIQIATLDMKLDAILKLLNKHQVEFKPFEINVHDHKHVGINSEEIRTNPPQWPLESYTDYLKRIGQYNEARSEDEYFGEVYK